MNSGERDELICKLFLVHLRDTHGSLFGIPVTSVGFGGANYGKLPMSTTIASLPILADFSLTQLANSIGICKAPIGAKADVFINGKGVSLKSLNAAPPALVNHTSRPGFEFACKNANTEITQLDNIVGEYWRLRKAGIIAEDTRISDANCPFEMHRQYLQPIIEYFLFDGTGSRLSSFPAEYILEFSNPIDICTYRKLTRENAFTAVWPHLIFSLRAKKGMPCNYDPNTYKGANAESIAQWVSYIDGDYRGALHIRSSR